MITGDKQLSTVQKAFCIVLQRFIATVENQVRSSQLTLYQFDLWFDLRFYFLLQHLLLANFPMIRSMRFFFLWDLLTSQEACSLGSRSLSQGDRKGLQRFCSNAFVTLPMPARHTHPFFITLHVSLPSVSYLASRGKSKRCDKMDVLPNAIVPLSLHGGTAWHTFAQSCPQRGASKMRNRLKLRNH